MLPGGVGAGHPGPLSLLCVLLSESASQCLTVPSPGSFSELYMKREMTQPRTCYVVLMAPDLSLDREQACLLQK